MTKNSLNTFNSKGWTTFEYFQKVPSPWQFSSHFTCPLANESQFDVWNFVLSPLALFMLTYLAYLFFLCKDRQFHHLNENVVFVRQHSRFSLNDSLLYVSSSLLLLLICHHTHVYKHIFRYVLKLISAYSKISSRRTRFKSHCAPKMWSDMLTLR